MLKKYFIFIIMVMLFLTNCGSTENSTTTSNSRGVAKEDLRFVIVPKVVHAWFDEVNKGAQEQADLLSEQLGVNVEIDYRAPTTADVAEQNSVLEQSAATRPTGIALDPNDYEGSRSIIEEIEAQGIPVVLFDSPYPEGSSLTTIGNDFAEQGRLAAIRLVELIGENGKVAVMQGVPTAPNHVERYEAQVEYLKRFPGIEVIEGGISNDSIEEAQSQAAAIIATNPDLKGYLMVDASAPIGIGAAIKESGKVGIIKSVAMDNLIDILNLVKDGTFEATSSTVPRMQGSMAVLMMYQKHLGMATPKIVDTGIDFIDQDNVDYWIEVIGKQD